MKEPTGKLARWTVCLQLFEYTLVHRKGFLNVVPDFLSRIPSEVEPEVSAVDKPRPQNLNVALQNLDPFYLKSQKNISSNPEKYPH